MKINRKKRIEERQRQTSDNEERSATILRKRNIKEFLILII